MNRQQHMKADEMLLGYTNEDVHKIIDIAVKYLGAGHRIAYHTCQTLDWIEMFFGKGGRRIALLHILIDARIVDRDFIESYIDSAG